MASTRVAVFGVVEGGVVINGRHRVAWVVTAGATVAGKNGGGRERLGKTGSGKRGQCSLSDGVWTRLLAASLAL